MDWPSSHHCWTSRCLLIRVCFFPRFYFLVFFAVLCRVWVTLYRILQIGNINFHTFAGHRSVWGSIQATAHAPPNKYYPCLLPWVFLSCCSSEACWNYVQGVARKKRGTCAVIQVPKVEFPERWVQMRGTRTQNGKMSTAFLHNWSAVTRNSKQKK